MAQIFLYPTVVGLTAVNFEKIDIGIGTGTLTSALFGNTRLRNY